MIGNITKKVKWPVGMALALLLTGQTAIAETFSTATLISRSLAGGQQCLDWSVIGVCFWLVCSLFECHIETTAKIKHYLPDLTFSAFKWPGENPWDEARIAFGALAKSSATMLGAPGGGDTANLHQDTKTPNVVFNEVNAIGNPAASLMTAPSLGVVYLCRTDSIPLNPYYLSELDALAWRDERLEGWRPEALIPGLREIGNWPINTWGNVFPRVGFLHQVDPPKAAAVAAQRAADIVTQEGQLHVYQPYGWSGHKEFSVGDVHADTREACEDSGGIWRRDHTGTGDCLPQKLVQWLPPAKEKTDHWQMISPTLSACESFGAPGAWSDGKQSDDRRFAWNYWREYRCCIPGPGAFLYSVEF